VLALIYGASMIRNEIDDRSIAHIITSPVDRRISYLGYYLPLVTVLCIVITVITFAGGLLYMLISSNAGGGMEIILSFMVVMWLGVLAYSSIFLVLGVVMNQPLYLGLFFVFIWEGFIGSIPGAIGEYTIRHQLRVITADMVDYGSISSVQGDAAISFVILMAISIAFVIIGAYAFREKEFA
ncbi:MAG TPA: ABC transporter permease subunit, partial [Methanomassiliicoccales archaeon]|nr:ABC transporter permease subunit [Methanomassiliicoccales archaeon]